jgi:hypothetical protein
VTHYGLDDQAIEVRSPAEAKIFPLSSVSRQALGSTQPPVQWVKVIHSPGVKRGRGVTLTTHPLVVPRSRMSRSNTFPLRLHRRVVRVLFTILPLYANTRRKERNIRTWIPYFGIGFVLINLPFIYLKTNLTLRALEAHGINHTRRV